VTGKRFTLLGAVSEFAEAIGKLDGHTLGDAVRGFTANVVSIQRKDLGEAVEEFIASDEPRTRATNGQRAQLSSEYARIRAIFLRRFAGTFENTAVCDLAKGHLDAFVRSLAEFSAKYRNHHRAAIRQFLSWCVRKDYLAATHRLGEADQMRPEHANTAEVEFYSASELRSLLEAADGPMQALLAIGALAGLRTQELLRLDWSDVWRVPGHIEVTAGKAKTRQRRLVEIGTSLSAWLDPFRKLARGKIWPTYDNAFQVEFPKLCERIGVKRKTNGLRHAFCSYHFAAHANENLTAALAGNAPAMIHAHYKGLATKAEAEKWFAVAPVEADNVVPMKTSNSP
jgi:integrase